MPKGSAGHLVCKVTDLPWHGFSLWVPFFSPSNRQFLLMFWILPPSCPGHSSLCPTPSLHLSPLLGSSRTLESVVSTFSFLFCFRSFSLPDLSDIKILQSLPLALMDVPTLWHDLRGLYPRTYIQIDVPSGSPSSSTMAARSLLPYFLLYGPFLSLIINSFKPSRSQSKSCFLTDVHPHIPNPTRPHTWS